MNILFFIICGILVALMISHDHHSLCGMWQLSDFIWFAHKGFYCELKAYILTAPLTLNEKKWSNDCHYITSGTSYPVDDELDGK